MKNPTIYLIPVLVIASLLSGCANAPVEVVQNQEKQQVSQSSNQPSVQDVMPNGGRQSRFGDKLSCDLLKGEVERTNCQAQMNEVIGMALENEIMSSFDASRCGVFPEEMAKECQTRITDTGVKGPVSSDEILLFNQALQPVFPENPGENGSMGINYDSKKCQELKTEGLKAYCEKTIAERMDQEKLSEIIVSGDLKRCDELSSAMQEQCKMMLGAPSPEALIPPTAPVMEEVPAVLAE